MTGFRCVFFVVAIALAGCSSGNSGGDNGGNKGSLVIAGSTALLPLVKQAAQDYQAKHPDVKISVSGGGSRVGITQAASKAIDIGNSDIPPSANPELVDHKVAVVGFAVIVNPNAGITQLTKQQIVDLFTGKATNWKQVGGKDTGVVIINRPSSSGTRAVFVDKLLAGKQPTSSGTVVDSSGIVASTVASTPGAVSYVALGYLKNASLTATRIDGVAPSVSTITGGKYPFWSFEHMLTNGPPSKDAADFIKFVAADKALLTKLGFISTDAMGSRAR